MITLVKLVDGSDEFVFQDASLGNYDDVVWTKLSIASPGIRESVRPRTGASGTYDDTRYFGSRAVSMDVFLANAPAKKLDALSKLMHPARRPFLQVTDSDWSPVTTRRLLVRSSQWSSEIINTGSWFRDVPLQWVAPLGVWEASTAYMYTVDASIGDTGRSYDLVYPRSYPPTGGVGLTQFDNPGNTESDFVARLYGPCIGPRLTNNLTGESVVFKDSFSLGSGEYVELDIANTTALLNSDPSLTRMNFVDFSQTTWFQVNPGFNAIRYNPIGGVDAGCIAEISFRPFWI